MTNPTPHGQVPEALIYAELPDLDDTLWLAIGQHRRAITIVETSAAAKAVDAAVHSLLRAYADATHALRAPQPSPTAQAASSAVLKAIREANMQLVRMGDNAFMLVPYKAATAQAAESVPAVSDLPPLPDPDLRDVGTKPQDVKDFLNGYATEYARLALASRDPAESVLEDAARWQWLADYLIGERTDLDEGIVACTTVDALRKFADAARKQGANHD